LNIENEAIQILTKEIVRVIKTIVNKAQFDKTVKGRIISVLGNNKYSVLIDGNEYVALYRNNDLSVNDVVYVTIVQNNYNNLIIQIPITKS